MSKSIISRSKAIYEKHKVAWEKEFPGKFVAIEPESGEFFIADTFDNAVALAIQNHPTRVSHTIRIGHDAAIHIGLMAK